MILDLSKLHGAREHFARTFPPSDFDPQDDDYRVAAPVDLSMDVEKAGDDIFRVHGRASTTLELDCSRCIEPFAVPLGADFDLRYVPQTANAGEGEQEIADDDLATAFHREGQLDVIEMLREQFQLALPMKPLCSDACRGLCPVCGANHNRTECDCRQSWEDPRLAPLKGLITRDEES